MHQCPSKPQNLKGISEEDHSGNKGHIQHASKGENGEMVGRDISSPFISSLTVPKLGKLQCGAIKVLALQNMTTRRFG